MKEPIKKRKPFSEEHRLKISKAKMGHKVSEETRKKIGTARKGQKNALGFHHTEEARRKIGTAQKGNKHSLGFHPTEEIRLKMSESHKGKHFSEEHRKNMSLTARRGEKSNLWQGGITPINKAIRKSLEYKLWREAVFKRDNFTCIWCGARSGKNNIVVLNADHIKPFSLFPELRFAIDNGRTLCIDCHKKTETYAGKIISYRSRLRY